MRTLGNLLLIVLMAIAVTACQGQNKPAETKDNNTVQKAPQPGADVEGDFESQTAEEQTEYSGTDMDEFVSQWEALGERRGDLEIAIKLREEVDLLMFSEWHIGQINAKEAEIYPMDFDPGAYRLQALCGSGFDALNLYVVDPESQLEGEYIVYDDRNINAPMISHTFESAQNVELVFEPIGFHEGVENAWYAWCIYKQE